MSASGPDDDRFAEAAGWFARMRGPNADKVGFEAWRGDPLNAEAYREMEAIWIASASASPEVVGRRRPVRLRPGLIAACLGAALTLAFLAWQRDRATDASATAIYASENGAIRTMALADGSHITLDAGSRVSVALGGHERLVSLLAGRARFAVAKDPGHPFVVLAGAEAVVARGTLFDVRLRGKETEVALLEGAVDVERRVKGGPVEPLARLRPGQSLRIGRDVAVPRIGVAGSPAWVSGVFAAQDVSLGELVAEANRYGDKKIGLADPDLAGLRLSGGFRVTQARELAQGVAAALDLAVSEQPGGDIVLSKRLVAPGPARDARSLPPQPDVRPPPAPPSLP